MSYVMYWNPSHILFLSIAFQGQYCSVFETYFEIAMTRTSVSRGFDNQRSMSFFYSVPCAQEHTGKSRDTASS